MSRAAVSRRSPEESRIGIRRSSPGSTKCSSFLAATPDAGENIQKLTYGATSWIATSVMIRTQATYPRVALLPDGTLFVASPALDDRKNYVYRSGNKHGRHPREPMSYRKVNQAASTTTRVGKARRIAATCAESRSYPQMRFAIINGVNAWVKDLGQANPTWQIMGTRPAEIGATERHYANSTLLPTGQIFVSGGVGPSEHDHDALENQRSTIRKRIVGSDLGCLSHAKLSRGRTATAGRPRLDCQRQPGASAARRARRSRSVTAPNKTKSALKRKSKFSRHGM